MRNLKKVNNIYNNDMSKSKFNLPIEKIKHFYNIFLEKPNIDELVIPLGNNKQNFLLNRWAARLFINKFLKVIQKIYLGVDNKKKLFIAEKIDSFFSMPIDYIEKTIRRPEATSLILYLNQAFKDENKEEINLFPFFLTWIDQLITDKDDLILTKEGIWYKHYFPYKKNEKEAILFDMSEDEFKDWKLAMTSGLEIVNNSWKESYEEIKENIFQIMPIRSEGLNPYNYSVHGFRGLILCGKRPDYMLAQSFVHETGHNKFSTILDLFNLIENFEEKFYSPFVNQDRPLIFIFHGIFSFLQDLYISQRMISKVNEVSIGSIERYIKLIQSRIETALKIIKEKAHLTTEGQKIYNSFMISYNDFIQCK